MTLVQALRARDRGEVVEPDHVAATDGLGSIVASVPVQPAPKPDDSWRSDPVFQEAREQAGQDRAEMAARLHAKVGQATTSEQAERLARAEQALTDEMIGANNA
jgi:hypothetical protein